MNRLVSVVVPFYNEVENVPRLAEKIDAALAPLPDFAYECLFVNDGSADGTREAIAAAALRFPAVRAVHLVRNSGQSAALVAGMRRAKGDFIFILDGDLQNDPCDFPAMLRLLEEYDCVFGYRAKRQDTFVRKLSSKVANGVRRRILGDGVRDAGCGSKGFRRACVEHLVSFNGQHRFFAVLMRKAGKTIAEFEVTHHPRQFGQSKYGVSNRLWRGIYDLFGVQWLKRRYVPIVVEGEDDA